ncbi:MAG: NAD(P)/FAD-dependent oxidoreductase [Desulfatibacillaceae bacterium]
MSQETGQYDVVILGCGPAGLQAAIHAARTKARVALAGRLDKSSLSRAHVENYCCMDSVVEGGEMLAMGRAKAEKFGTEVHSEDILELRQDGDVFVAKLESGASLAGKAIVLAMGISRNRLGVPGEKDFVGKGVSYCVDCDGMFFRNQDVVVAGNGSAAFSGALTMMMIANKVHLVYQKPEVSDVLAAHIKDSDIILHEGRWPAAVKGMNEVEAVVLDNDETIEVKGLFVELGAKGAMELATVLGVMLDAENAKYVEVNRKMETNVPGIYAAGDITGPPWQMAKAVGEGCVAGLEAAAFARKKATGE